MTTGGSTGSPLKILMDREYRSRNHASTRYYLTKAGITPGVERGVRLHGNTIPKDVTNSGEFWIDDEKVLPQEIIDTAFTLLI